MPNKHLSQPPTELIRSRLEVLLENVNTLYSSNETVLESDIVSAYHAAINVFLKSLDGSVVGAVSEITKGSPSDPFHYNVFVGSMSKDLEALYSEVGALDKLISSSFNSIISEREQTIQTSKRVSDKLGTYLLYADQNLGGGFFFGDSFNSPQNIEVASTLLDTDECFLGQNEGVILLPLDGDPDRPKIKSYVINEPSNGSSGNNYEIGVLGKNEIEAIGDNEPNTWYEYERVTAYESDKPLTFDLTIALDEISVINHIHINPINFGTPTPVSIVKIETSKDGIEYTSVKDEIPIKDFVSEDEENTFDLSPATSKFAGQGFYSFLPRKTQFVHLVLEQHTPYSISTTNGTRLRYAIGIRDFNILGRKFKPEGSIISAPFNTGEEAKKIALWASENPVEQSLLADITHSISENDGAVWHAVQPQRRSGFDTPEVINFNNISPDSIVTDSPVTSLRHKISMKRNDDSFSGDVTLKQDKETKIDILNLPTGGDFSMNTTERPIEESVRVILPFYGSYSCPTSRYGNTVVGQSAPMDLDFLEFNVDVPPVDSLRYKLPFENFSNLQEHIRVLINGEQIEYCAKDEDALGLGTPDSYTSYVDGVDENSKVYFLNRGGKEIQFGYTDSSGIRRGFLPPTGAKIQVCLDGDNPRLELTSAGYVLMLSGSSDGFKENVSLISMDNFSSSEAKDHFTDIPSGRDKVNVDVLYRTSDQFKDYDFFNKIGINKVAHYDSRSKEKLNIAYNKIAPDVTILKKDPIEDSLDTGFQQVAVDSDEGSLPPVFLQDSDTWEIIEYALDSDIPLTTGLKFTDKKDFIDGRQELLEWDDPEWIQNENAYSFNPYTGAIYLGSIPATDRKVVFKCKTLESTVLPSNSWEYYKTEINGRINTSKIVIHPKYVVTHKKEVSVSSGLTSVELIPNQLKSHDWFKQKLVKGTLVIDPLLFAEGTKLTEVKYIDGQSELASITHIEDESVVFELDSGLYKFELSNINLSQTLVGMPGFSAIRLETEAVAQENLFTTYTDETPDAPGEWTYEVDSVTGVCTVHIKVHTGVNPSLRPHSVSYKYKSSDPGIDANGIYSVDYETSTIHFANQTIDSGVVKFEVSCYSAFYNIAEVVQDGDIEEINEDDKTIKFSNSLGMRFLKMTTAMKARPAFAKVVYDYYKKSTESLADLKPYFSPICKDVAFKAVTASTLEEL